ncbi:putative FCP1 homology domain-containing protein [Psilocybe cubensis]|nr:putative FCP1 homology domain-containing protein [Psilocybe cubensis]KAH9475518.1 putative FCP1 homology domain-containing protein [Psilocybe cubensis]
MPPSSMSTELLASRGTSHSPRPRSASPPPPRRTEPREEYLRLSQEPSSYVEAPEKARKLIVLDLNGSLLLRSAHQRRLPTPRQAPHSQDQSTDPYADPTVLRPLRVVHPRPYLSSFITYILHPKTKQWLDTMVWSSAQPHSVNDMVDKCFKERRQELKAVWARDTLGLTNNEYHRKTLTLKDLEKPWAELPLVSSNDPKPPSDRPPPPTSSSPTSDSVSLPNGAAESDPPATTSQTTHSARTTLLIDDSPLKAALQPWNHLVIPEYVQEMRNKDLKVAELVREKEMVQDRTTEQSQDKETGATVSEDLTDEIKADALSQPLSDAVPAPVEINAPSAASDSHLETSAADNGPDATADTQSNRALKRLQKKEAGKLKRAEEHAKRISEVVGDQKFDQTLLAVIGILDRVKWEDNVAGWMRSGGLVNVEGVNVHHFTGETSVKDAGVPTLQSVPDLENEREEETSKRPLSHTPPTRSRDASASPSPDDGTIPGSGSKKRRRVSDQAENLSTVEEAALDTGMDTSVDGAVSQPNEATSTDISLAQMQSTQAQPDDQEKIEEEKAEQSATGIPVISSPNSMLVPQPPNPLCDDDGEQSKSLKLWYEYPEVLAFWAERGQRALGELGIEVTSGILLNGSARRKVST